MRGGEERNSTSVSSAEVFTLEVFFVKDELDVALRVGQALLLQVFGQLRWTAQEDPDFRSGDRKTPFRRFIIGLMKPCLSWSSAKHLR